MLQENETFFTIIGCMDGRCQEAVSLFGQERFGAVYPDTITEAGLVGQLSRLQSPEAIATGGQAKENVDQQLLRELKKKIDISLKHHHSKGILVFGHEDCAGNPVNNEKHKQDVLAAVSVIRTLVDNPALPIVPLFVTRTPHNDLSEWTADVVL